MAPNRKKKKPISNPARGFATTSQPSKAKELRDTADQNAEVSHDHTDDKDEANGVPVISTAKDSAKSNLVEMSPEELEAHLEDSELQHIIESSSARCKQDAARQVTRLETEHRQLRAQSHRLSTASWLRDDALELVMQMKSVPLPDTTIDKLHGLTTTTDPILKLWTLRLVLVKLNFPEIDDALRYLLMLSTRYDIKSTIDSIWGLQEILEWYATQDQQERMPDYDHGHSSGQTPMIDTSDDSDFETPVDTPTVHSAPTTTPPSEHTHSDREAELEDLDELPALSASNSEEEDDPSAFTDKYLHLRSLLFDTENYLRQRAGGSPTLEKRKARLHSRIEKIRRDVLFDADLADAIWRERLLELEIDASRSARRKKSRPKKPEVSQQTDKQTDEEDIMLGNMFGMADEDNSRVEGTVSSTIRVVDFGRWSGTQPRRLLEESCRVLDGQCVVKFNTLSATSYSTRQKVDLRWSARRTIDEQARSALPNELKIVSTSRSTSIEMESIAAATPAQAESYLSTTLLFLILHSGMADQKQANRLPTVWRDIYVDLVRARQSQVDASDKDTLKHIRKMIDTFQADWSRVNDVPEPDASQLLNVPKVPQREQKNYTKLSPEDAQAQWNTRVSSTSYQSILQIREKLPVHGFKDQILQIIAENQLVLICADTGAGKSTQIPSFVLEYELSRGRDCRILVTQPRRISAISLARRVSQELGEHKNDLGTDRSLVGYAIRLESKTSKSTRITFATTGVLLRIIEATPQLDDLEYLILDEVHERSMDIDLLFIALKQLKKVRPDLKIILMSATVDAQKFSSYFDQAPIVDVPGRTFPVEIKYLEDAVEDTLDIKARTYGSKEVIEEDYDSDRHEQAKTELVGLEAYSAKTRSKIAQMDEYRIDYELTASLAEAIATKPKFIKYSSAILIFMPGIGEIRRLHNALSSRETFASNWIIHLLHSSFSTDDLERAFSIPPPGHRKIVIATNIAETGITIPDVTAVIDTCKEKVMRFDERRQLSKLTEGFISRSSARQRRGRAARVQEGLCFHLVTRHRFENLMLEQHVPEMLRLSLQDPILRIKVWNLGSIEETLAAAIDPPTSKNVRRAIDKLKEAGALSASEKLTPLGKIVARLPLEVILGKLAVFGIVFKCLDAVLTTIAALSSKSPFLPDKGGHQTDPRIAFAKGDSDLISTYNAYQGWRKAKIAGQGHQFCRKHHLSDSNLSSLEDQKTQLLVYLVDAGLLRLDHDERNTLNRSRNSNNNRKTFFEIPARYNTYNHDDPVINSVVALAFYPKLLVREGKGWRNIYSNQRVSLGHNSIVRAATTETGPPPKWLCFFEAMQTRSGALNVLETSRVPEPVIVTMLGTADVKFFSGVVVLDNGKARFSLRQWRQLAAIKTLRESLASVLERCWSTPGLAMSDSDARWIQLFANMVAGRDTKGLER